MPDVYKRQPDSVFGSGRHAAENVAFMHALEDVALSVPKWLLVAPVSYTHLRF